MTEVRKHITGPASKRENGLGRKETQEARILEAAARATVGTATSGRPELRRLKMTWQ